MTIFLNLCVNRMQRVLLSLQISVILLLIFSFVYFGVYGRLPTPYFDNAADSFMDFYSTAFWAYRDDRYTSWKSIYPSFTFLLAQLLTFNVDESCKHSAIDFRSCDNYAILYICTLFLIGVIITGKMIFSGVDKKFFNNQYKKLFIIILIFLAYPSLFAMDRGNLVLVSFLFFSLSCFYFHRWNISIPFYLLACFIKPYLVVLTPVYILSRPLVNLLLLMFWSFVIGFISDAYFLSFSALDLIGNIIYFNSDSQRSVYDILISATSIKSYLRVMDTERFHIYFSSYNDQIIFIKGLLLFCFCAYVLRVAAFVFDARRILQPEWLLLYLLAFMCFLFDGLGLYVLIFFYPAYVLYRQLHNELLLGGGIFSIIIIIMLPIPLGITGLRDISGVSYLSGVEYYNGYGVPLIAVLRPLFIILLMELIAYGVRLNKKLMYSAS